MKHKQSHNKCWELEWIWSWEEKPVSSYELYMALEQENVRSRKVTKQVLNIFVAFNNLGVSRTFFLWDNAKILIP